MIKILIEEKICVCIQYICMYIVQSFAHDWALKWETSEWHYQRACISNIGGWRAHTHTHTFHDAIFNKEMLKLIWNSVFWNDTLFLFTPLSVLIHQQFEMYFDLQKLTEYFCNFTIFIDKYLFRRTVNNMKINKTPRRRACLATGDIHATAADRINALRNLNWTAKSPANDADRSRLLSADDMKKDLSREDALVVAISFRQCKRRQMSKQKQLISDERCCGRDNIQHAATSGDSFVVVTVFNTKGLWTRVA